MTWLNANPIGLLRPEQRFFWLGLIGSVVLAVATPLLPLTVIAPLYNEVLAQGHFGRLVPLGVQALALSGLSALAMYAQDALFGRGAARFGERMRATVFERMLASDPLELMPRDDEAPHTGRTAAGRVARAVLDLRELETFYAQDLAVIASQGLVVVVAIFLLMLENPRFTLGLVLVMLVLFAALGWIGRRVERAFRATQDAAEVATGRMSEGVRKLELVKVFQLERALLGRFVQPNRAQALTSARRSRLLALQAPLSQLTAIVGLGALLAVALREVAAGQMNAGQMTAYVVLLSLLITPVQMVSRAVGRWATMREPVRSLRELLARPAEVDTGTLEAPEAGWRGAVRFERVTARYPGASEPVLRELDLELRPGEVVALVGPSGSGKTSVARLLLRILRPETGRIVLDGHDLGEYRLSSLRRQVTLVPQQPGLFAGTVRENLRLVRPDADDDQLWAALEAADLAEPLRIMPHQLETVLGEEGAGLSGGQAQRLAIARALLCGATVLILDEPTSALDPQAESMIERTIERLRGRFTVLVVAHRTSTITCADRVVRLEAGRLVEVRVLRQEPVATEG
jgi:ATP-binding cassette subfamily B protein